MKTFITTMWALSVLLALGCSGSGGETDSGTTTGGVTGSGTTTGGVTDSGTDLAPPTDITITTADLGWNEADEVRGLLIEALANLEPGDVFYLSHMYRLAPGGVDIPDGITLYASAGAGFDLQDLPSAPDAYLTLGNESTLYNVSIIDQAPAGSEDFVRGNNKTAIKTVSGATGLRIVNCLFDADTKVLLDLRQVEDLVISGTHLHGGYYQILMRAPSGNIHIQDSLFSDSFGDGIKTQRAGDQGCEDILIEDTVFEDNLRDGIDTTGGFRNALVRNCIFRRNHVSGMDIKNIYEFPHDLGPGRGNDDINVMDCEFVDMNNGMVFTTLDRNDPQLITDANHANYLPHDIYIRRCIFESNSDTGRAFLFKDAHDIYWEDAQLLGGISEYRAYGLKDDSAYEATRPDLSNTNYNLVGVRVTTGSARGSSENYPFAEIGPRLTVNN